MEKSVLRVRSGWDRSVFQLAPVFKIFAGLFIVMMLGACGHSFNARSDTNYPPNPYFTDRDFIKKGVPEAGDRIDDWVGKIATWDGIEYTFYNQPYLKNNKRPVVTAEQKNYSYHATIDKNWTFGLSVPFVKADATGQTAYEVTMIDTANVAVAPEDEVQRGDSFDAEARNRGIADPSAQGLYWVKGVALEVVTVKAGVKLSANAAVNGDGFGASGGDAYDATETQTFPLLSVWAIPMNAKADAEARARRDEHKGAQESFAKSVGSEKRLDQPVMPALRRDPKTGLVPYRLQK